MPYDENGQWVSPTAGFEPTAGAVPAADPYTSTDPAAVKKRNFSFEQAMAEANSRGPGYGVVADGAGGYTVAVTDQNAAREATLRQQNPTVQPVIPTVAGVQGQINGLQPQPPHTALQNLQNAAYQGVGQYQGQPLGAPRVAVTGPTTASRLPAGFAPSAGMPGTPGGPTPEEIGPAEVDRSRIDALLGNVSKANSGLMGLADSQSQFSAAQAQLSQGLDTTQRQNLALARSGNRRDTASMQARAIQSNTELGAQTTQAAAGLRAQEEQADRQIRLQAYKAAGDLGLNAGALELDVNRMNMGAATNYLNQLFAKDNLKLQLDEAEAARVTNFVRDMALISKDYYALDAAERDAVRKDLTARYAISEQAQAALAQLDAQNDTNWTQIGASLGVAAIGAGATILTAGAAAPAAIAATGATYAATS